MKKVYFLLMLCFVSMAGFAQTVNVYATGTSGSYKTGYVNGTPTNFDGNIQCVFNATASSNQRGWAVFNIASANIPAGATITSVVLHYNIVTYTAGTTSSLGGIFGYAGDMSTFSGSATNMYANAVAGEYIYYTSTAGTPFGSVTGNASLATTQRAQDFIQGNISSTAVSLCWTESSGTRSYVITGETGTTATTGAFAPYLAITYVTNDYRTMPLAASSFNFDLVANGTGAPSATTNATNTFGGGYDFLSGDYRSGTNQPAGTDHLPMNGAVSSSSTSGLHYQLASYTGNNALFLNTGSETGTITPTTPQYASALYILGDGSNTPGNETLVVNYADGTTQSTTLTTLTDWFTSGTNAMTAVGRVNYTSAAPDAYSSTTPYMHEAVLNLTDYTSKVQSVVITNNTTTSQQAIFAMSNRSGTLTSSVSSLTAFGSCVPTVAQIFSVTGTSLYPSGGGLTATAPTGFQVSSNGTTWGTTATITYAANTATNLPVYVRFNPSSNGAYSGNVTFTGGTVNTSPSVAVTGTATGLILSPSTVAAFGNITQGTPSASQTYSLSGTGLANGTVTVISSNTDFQVSPDNATWAGTYNFANGATVAANLYVRFKPTILGAETSTITVTGTSFACSYTVAATGTGVLACVSPSLPTAMTFVPTTAYSLSVGATPNSTADGYLLVIGTSPFVAGSDPISGHTYSVTNTFGNGTVYGVYTTSPPYTVTGLSPNTTYYFTVVPYNGGATGTCGGGPLYPSGTQLTSSVTTCAAVPTTITTSGTPTQTSFTLTWPASVGGATSYNIDISTNNTFTAPILGSTFNVIASASPSLTVTGLMAGTTYYCRVSALASCTSVYSNTLTVATATGTGVVISNGFNYDVIANGASTVPASTTIGSTGYDGGGWVFYSNDFYVANGSGGAGYAGLPNSGTFNSANTANLPYVMASYSANNCLWLPASVAGNTGTLTFATPIYASTLYVMGNTGGGTGSIGLVANYTDGTSQASSTVSYGDWFSGTTAKALANIGRVGQTNNVDGTTGGPNLYENTLAITTYTKQIKSVTITTNSGGTGYTGIFAVSARTGSLAVSANSIVFPLTNSCVTSTAQIFSVSGTYLYPSNGSITVTAPLGFLVSNNGVTYGQTANIAYTGNTMTNAPVYVEFAPGLSGGVTSGTLTFSGGTVNTAPAVNVSGTLSGMALTPANTVAAFGNIAYQTLAPFPIIYNLSGSGLTPGTISVSVVSSIGNDFLVAPDNGTPTPYGTTYNITAGATLTPTPIYVQFTPSIMGAESATVTITGGGQTCSQIINATGTGTVACSQPGAPTTILFPGTNATGTNINFAVNGTPTGYLVVQSTTAATPSISPANGFVYTPGSAFGTNATVINNYNSAPPLAVTTQTGNTKYYMNVYAYNGGPAGTCGSGPYYAPTALAGSYITCPATPVVANSNVSLNSFTLSWSSCAGGGATTITYFVSVATDAAFTSPVANYPVVVADNVGTVTTNITGLSMGTTYYYKVIALGSCNSIAAIGSIITSTLSYCTPTIDADAPGNGQGSGCSTWYASSVVGGGINFSASSGCGAGNQLSQVATVTPGSTLSLAITLIDYTGCGIWVDWNNNGTFENTELAYNSNANSFCCSSYNVTGTVNVPTGQAPGNYRMRFIAGWATDCYGPGGNATNAIVDAGSHGYGPCGAYNYETYEDFTVHIASAASSFSASPLALNFGSTQICNATTSQSVTISSASLSPTVGTVYVFAPNNYQVSTASTGPWLSSVTYPYTGGAINSTVWVRYDPTATGVDTGHNLIFSGGGVSPMPKVALTGTATTVPSIQPITGTLNYCFAGSVTSPLGDGLSGGNWASSNTAVGTIDNSGNFTTHGIGTTLVTYSTLNCSVLSTVSTTVHVYPVPASSITAASSNTISSTADCNSVTLTANTDIGNYFTWYQNGTAITNDSTATYLATTSGTYYVVSKYSVTGCNTASAPVVVTILPHPTASISTPSNSTFACVSLPMTAVTDIGNKYSWTDNGSTVSAATTYTATTSGTYGLTITNTVTGCFTVATMNVVIDANPTTTVTGSGVPNQMVSCGTLTLTASPATGNYFTWYQNGVQVQQGASNTYHAPISGTYYVNVMDVVGGCNNNSGNIVATINQVPTSAISTQGNTTTACGSLILTGSSDIGNTYEWSHNGSPVSAANPYTATVSGTYTLNSDISGTGCNTNSSPVVVTINAVPTSILSTQGNITSACGDIVMTATSNAGNEFTWYNNGIEVQQGASNTYIATVTSTYYVNSGNSGTNCNTNSATEALTIYPAPLATINPLGPTSICQGQSVVLEANAGGGLNYNWIQDNTSTGGTGIDYTAGTSGSYHVIVKNANNCYDTSTNIVVVVNPLPTPVISAAGSVLSTGSYSTYQWYLNGLEIPGATNGTYTALLNGSYTVLVTDNNGCAATSQPSVISGLGVANVQGGNINIYPNPNNGSFNIVGTMQTTDNNIAMEITDVAGQVVMRTQFKANNGAINKMVNLDPVMAPGMYLVRLKSDQANLVWQFVKQ